jgi:mono/diheme cytochrome c family protein
MGSLFVRALAACLLALSLSGAALAEDAAGDAANGKLVYLKLRCFTCHGRAGQGGLQLPGPRACRARTSRGGVPSIPARTSERHAGVLDRGVVG